MEPYVLDYDFKVLAVIDVFESLIWTERFFGPGDFEIVLPATTDNLNYCRPDRYLWLPETDVSMIIEKVEINTDAESGNHIILSGRSLESILDRRIVWTQTRLSGSLNSMITRLLNENVISPTISARAIPSLSIKSISSGVSTSYDFQYTGDSLLKVIEELCVLHNVGMRISLAADNKFEFSTYTAADRSYGQKINPYVVFSPEFENLLSSSFVNSISSYKNVALVAGEGEYPDRKTFVSGNTTQSGLSRRETYVDARDISSNAGTPEEVPIEEYYSQLNSRGKSKIEELSPYLKFSGEIVSILNPIYGRDFFLGDLVQVTNEYGFETVARVTELVRFHDSSKLSVYPTFETY